MTMVLPNGGVGGDLPLRLGGASVTHRGAEGFDVYVDGVPFLLNITDEIPFVDGTAKWRKEQFDATPEPGEQSLSDWWMRSQLSFHGGAGQKFLDSYADSDAANRLRFDTSFNVEVHESGVVTTLPAAEVVLPGDGFVFTVTDVDGFRRVLAVDGNLIRWWRETADGPLTGEASHGSTFPIQSACTDGDRLFVASEGGVFAVDQAGASTKLYDVPGSPPRLTLGWAKQRLLLAVDRAVYQLSPAPASTALPEPVYTHPTAGWEWTCFAEAPETVLAAGRAGSYSTICAFALTAVADAPALGPAVVMAAFPHGETVHSLCPSAGTWLGIGTSKGLRIGRYDQYNGNLSYGPLTIETVAPVRAQAATDRFLFVALEGLDGYSSCLGKVDLGTPVDDGGRFAWSPHQPPPQVSLAPIRHVTVDDLGLLLFSMDGVGVCRQDPATPTSLPAWLSTSRIRMGTLEWKSFRYLRVRAELAGDESITVAASSSQDPSRALFTVRAGREAERVAVGFRAEWCQVRFELSPGARMSGYTVYALPAQERYRSLQVPLILANSQRNRSGRTFQAPGWALDRLGVLKEIEARGDEVELLIPALGYPAMRGVIEETTVVQVTPPTDRGANGLLGVVQIVFRTTT